MRCAHLAGSGARNDDCKPGAGTGRSLGNHRLLPLTRQPEAEPDARADAIGRNTPERAGANVADVRRTSRGRSFEPAAHINSEPMYVVRTESIYAATTNASFADRIDLRVQHRACPISRSDRGSPCASNWKASSQLRPSSQADSRRRPRSPASVKPSVWPKELTCMHGFGLCHCQNVASQWRGFTGIERMWWRRLPNGAET